MNEGMTVLYSCFDCGLKDVGVLVRYRFDQLCRGFGLRAFIGRYHAPAWVRDEVQEIAQACRHH